MRDCAVRRVVRDVEREDSVCLEDAAPFRHPRAQGHVDVELEALVGAALGLVGTQVAVWEEHGGVGSAVELVRGLP